MIGPHHRRLTSGRVRLWRYTKRGPTIRPERRWTHRSNNCTLRSVGTSASRTARSDCRADLAAACSEPAACSRASQRLPVPTSRPSGLRVPPSARQEHASVTAGPSPGHRCRRARSSDHVAASVPQPLHMRQVDPDSRQDCSLTGVPPLDEPDFRSRRLMASGDCRVARGRGVVTGRRAPSHLDEKSRRGSGFGQPGYSAPWQRCDTHIATSVGTSQVSRDFVPTVASRERIVRMPRVRYGPVTAPAVVRSIRP